MMEHGEAVSQSTLKKKKKKPFWSVGVASRVPGAGYNKKKVEIEI